MENHFDLSDVEFEKQFADQTLAPTLFNHEAHLRLAWLHIHKYGVDQAVINIPNQIMAYVQKLGAQEKYNHTLTIAAIKVISHFYKKSATQDFNAFVQMHPRLKNNFKDLVSAHYSINIFNDAAAKKIFLQPDLLAFD
jgi:hypothetical protein